MKSFLQALALLALTLTLAATVAAQDITLVPFTDETYGIQGLRPEGWQPAAPGVMARGSGPADTVVLAQQAAPLNADALLTALLPQLGLAEAPTSAGTLETGALEWSLYDVSVEVRGLQIRVHLAIAQGAGTSYLVLLQSGEDDAAALYESVFLPAVNALAPVTEATPEAPVPYIAEDVTFTNGDITLAGTLTLPEGDGPHAAVVLISGSGQQDRDESLAPLAAIKPFRLIADELTRAGYAVLRYDDRGAGESTGDPSIATTADFATDAAAAVEYLLSREEIDPAQIGLLGHSEGGMIAPILAAENEDVAFIIMLAGPGVSGAEISIEQSRYSMESTGVDEAEIETILGLVADVFDALVAGNPEASEARLGELIDAQLAALPEAQRQALGDLDAYRETQLQIALEQYRSPWMAYYLAFEPAEVLSQVDVPVLAIFGGMDRQVPAEQNAQAVEAALKAGGNEDFTLVTIPDMNHITQRAVTGGWDEYGTLEQTLHPDLMPVIIGWLQERFEATAS